MGNKILEKNLYMLNNEELISSLKNHTFEKIPVLKMESTGYNVEYDGILLHNLENPLAESTNIFNQSKKDKNSVFFIYGLGLGYLFQMVVQNCDNNIVVYEPNLDILLNSFSLVDFSNELNRENVFVFSDFEQCVQQIVSFVNQDTHVEILALDSYKNMYKDVFSEQVKKLELAFGSMILDYNFKKEKMYFLAENFAKNIPLLLEETPVSEYDNVYKGLTAIIVSAGPTLQENLEILKKYQNNAIIFVVGTALKTLVANDIKADFLCIVEAIKSDRQVEGIDLSDYHLILDSSTNNSTHKYKVKDKILHMSSVNPLNEIWAKMAKLDIEKYETCGTVSYCALDCAIHMGFSKIILVGQDLAYIDGQCYSKNSAYEDLICKFNPEKDAYEIQPVNFEKYAKNLTTIEDTEVQKEIALKRLSDLNNSLYTVKSVDGNSIPTEVGYASFIQHFENRAKNIKDIELINTSLKGALIEGYKNISLEEAMENSTPIEKFFVDKKYQYNKQAMLEQISKEKDNLERIISTCDENGKIASRLVLDMKRNQTMDKEKLLKIRKLIEDWSNLNTTSNLLFRTVCSKFEIEIDSYMKTVERYNDEVTKQVAEKFKQYYIDTRNTLRMYCDILIESIGEIK